MFQGISLFSGAGGMDVGFKQARIRPIWANDFDETACATYRLNIGNHIECGDINTFMDTLREYSGTDVVFGGPPCQGFSVAGKMDPNDPRSQLIWSFMKVVELVRPRVFVMENVRALGALAKFSAIRQGIFRQASKLGYTCQLVMLNSKNYGVPQSRERIFIFGYPAAAHIPPLEGIFSSICEEAQTAGQVLRELGPAGNPRNSHTAKAKITLAARPVLRKSPYAGMLFNGQGRPINPDTQVSTLHASMGGNRTPIVDERHVFEGGPSWVEEYHRHLMSGGSPYGMHDTPPFLRRLTIDEAIAFQTFPGDYNFQGKQSSIFRQVGNGVPCNLAFAVAKVATMILSGEASRANPGERQLSIAL